MNNTSADIYLYSKWNRYFSTFLQFYKFYNLVFRVWEKGTEKEERFFNYIYNINIIYIIKFYNNTNILMI